MALFKENHFGQFCVKHPVKHIIKIKGSFTLNWLPYCRSLICVKTKNKLKLMENSQNYFVQYFLVWFGFAFLGVGLGWDVWCWYGVGVYLIISKFSFVSWQYLTERKGERQRKWNKYSASKPHGCDSHISNCIITLLFHHLGLVKCHYLT